MMLKIVLGKKGKLIVDGTIIEVARLSRAKTKKIKRVSGKRYWVKRKRKIYSEHLKKEIEYVKINKKRVKGKLLKQ